MSSDLAELWDGCQSWLRARWRLRSATRLGFGVTLRGPLRVANRGTLMIGDRVELVSTTMPIELRIGPNATLEIGDCSYLNYGCTISATHNIQIGPRCLLGTHVLLMDGDERFECLHPRLHIAPSPIVLEENVWLCTRVTVLPGVTVGAHSVVAAGSLVTRDIPPRSLAGGVPARVLRSV